MAKGHWQIYNWDKPFTEEAGTEYVGDVESISIEQVPETIIKTALKVTRLIGDSLYGVDMKSHNDKHYVIEVNDNPNIDHGYEDRVQGMRLYQEIMSVFLQRIRRNHGYE